MNRAAPIRPIRNVTDHLAALAEIDRLFEAKPGSEERDRLEVLAILVAAYEREALGEPDPIDILAFAMVAQGRSQADLAQLLGSRSRASEILNRRRHLSAEMITRLSEAWSLPRELLRTPYAVASGLKRAALGGSATLLVLVSLFVTGIGGLYLKHSRGLPDAAELVAYSPPDLRRHAEDGELVAVRRFVPLAEIPAHVVKAFVAAEDQHFYSHGGFSGSAILRAAIHNLTREGSTQGAATITQQLAKNLWLADEPPSLARKIKEIILAGRIENELAKERILELYLNQIYFGGNSWGIGAAAAHYFGKTPGELSIAEAAYLAALPKAPNHYRLDLEQNLPRARERRDWVLARMADDGLITLAAAEFAREEPLTGAPSP